MGFQDEGGCAGGIAYILFAMKTKPKRPKALWYRIRFGNNPQPKPLHKIKPVSKSMAKKRRAYAKRVTEWKKGKYCVGSIVTFKGLPLCPPYPHPCEDNHHKRGRLGPLLMDERYWIPVCRNLHDWIGNHPEEARKVGLLCQPGEWNRPKKEEV